MYKKLAPCLVALLAASPALAQSVIVSESAVQTQALSPTLGNTESLAIVTPEMAAQMIQVPVVSDTPMISGEVSPTLGETESLAVVSPEIAVEMIQMPVAATTPAPAAAPASSVVVSSTQVEAAPVAGTATSGGYGTFVLSDPELSVIDSLPRITPAMAATLVVDELTVDAAAAPAEDDVSIYVVGDGEILPSTAWGAQDTQACKASGGVELPLPGGRIGCFKL